MRDLRELNINEGGRPVFREPPTAQQVQAFEYRFKVRLPMEYLAFLRFANGGHPEKDAFKPKGMMEDVFWGVNRFYHLDDDEKSTDGLWRATTEWQTAISQRIVPIASDSGGNQILLSFETSPPTVQLCIHDEGLRLVHVAESFSTFIDMLSEDPEMI